MPRRRERASTIADIELIMELTARSLILRMRMTGEVDERLQERLVRLRRLHFSLINARYLTPRVHTQNHLPNGRALIEELSDRAFKEEFRVSKEVFTHIHTLIKDHPVFISTGHKPQTPSDLQLLVCLNRIGFDGNGAGDGKVSRFNHTSIGSLRKFTRRVFTAVISLRDTYIRWPDSSQRRQLQTHIQRLYGFPNCVGFLDGTLFPLQNKPSSYGEDYWTRKACYAINAQVICDHHGRITYFYTGWVGSAHDQRVISNSRLYQNVQDYFDAEQYVLGDSAYTPHRHIVPAFKKLPHRGLPQVQQKFNARLARARIKAEHTIGVLKSRFQSLKAMRYLLDSEEKMAEIIDLQVVCVILHNLCIDFREDDSWLNAQIEATNDNDEGGDVAVLAPNGDINSGNARRSRLMAYFTECNWIT